MGCGEQQACMQSERQPTEAHSSDSPRAKRTPYKHSGRQHREMQIRRGGNMEVFALQRLTAENHI